MKLKKLKAKITPFLKEEWSGIERNFNESNESYTSNVSTKKIKELAKYLYNIPEEDKLFKKTKKIIS